MADVSITEGKVSRVSRGYVTSDAGMEACLEAFTGAHKHRPMHETVQALRNMSVADIEESFAITFNK